MSLKTSYSGKVDFHFFDVYLYNFLNSRKFNLFKWEKINIIYHSLRTSAMLETDVCIGATSLLEFNPAYQAVSAMVDVFKDLGNINLGTHNSLFVFLPSAT